MNKYLSNKKFTNIPAAVGACLSGRQVFTNSNKQVDMI